VNLHQKSLFTAFLSTLLLTLLMPVCMPCVRITYCIPFLIIAIYKKPLIFCLWSSAFYGLLLDLLSAHSTLGLFATNVTLTTWILYKQKKHFFADSMTTLPLMTGFFSVLFACLQLLLIFLFERKFLIHQSAKDFLMTPLLNALFSYGVFILPCALFGKPIRKGSDYFLQDLQRGN